MDKILTSNESIEPRKLGQSIGLPLSLCFVFKYFKSSKIFTRRLYSRSSNMSTQPTYSIV
jgi:hypothetical protein